jgi:hypothetical protein
MAGLTESLITDFGVLIDILEYLKRFVAGVIHGQQCRLGRGVGGVASLF